MPIVFHDSSIDPSKPEQCLRICLTPTKNESWIIRPFLAAAKSWADHVIVADQGSTDGTSAEISATTGAVLVENKSPTYDESYRQQLLLSQARKIPGKRILIGLDADEALSANFSTSRMWNELSNAKPGTIIRFRWANILPGFRKVWIQPIFIPFGFVDDGAMHNGKRIHSPRVPQPSGAPIIDVDDVVVLHFQYVILDRMRSKQRWYQVWEHATNKQKTALQIYREYNHMNGGWPLNEIQDLPSAWMEGYEKLGIDFRSLQCEPVTWWNKEVVNLLQIHGTKVFRKIAIWDENWNEVAKKLGTNNINLSDPRSFLEKIIHKLLAVTQSRRASISTRCLEKILRLTGW